MTEKLYFNKVEDLEGVFSTVCSWGDQKGKIYEAEWYELIVDGDDDAFVTANPELKFKLILQEGGGEGGAEDCRSVFKVGDQYFMVNYNYYSYNGFDFDYASITEVEPYEKIVIDYRPV